MSREEKNLRQREAYKRKPRVFDKKYLKSYYINNKEKTKENAAIYRKNNPEKRLLTALKNRAKNSGLECNVELQDIIIPKFCPILNIPLTVGGDRESSPSVDRIDSTKGYIKGNIAVISFRANRLKADGSLAEHIAIANWMEKKLMIQSIDKDLANG